jgi:hypothetical protein
MPDKAESAKQIDDAGRKRLAVKPVSQERLLLREKHPPLTMEVQRAILQPGRAGPADILALQRLAGNRAVSRLIQAKLPVGPPGDRYEREADRVAEQVIGMPSRSPAVQRQEEEEEELQTKPLAATITPIVQRQDEEEEVQMRPLVQRQEEEEEELQTKPLLQRGSDGSFEAGSALEGRLAARKGGGSPLADEVRTFMEPRFGADFGDVRVHTGSEAAQMNRELSAQAFTHGQDIYLGAGRFDPGTTAGKRLLAHELTHVVQQSGGHVQRNAERTNGPVVQRWGKKKKTETTKGDLTASEDAKKYFEELKGKRFLRKKKRRRLAVEYYRTKIKAVKEGTLTDEEIRKLTGIKTEDLEGVDVEAEVAKGIKKAYKSVFNEDYPEVRTKEELAEELKLAHVSWGGVEGATPDYADNSLADQSPDAYKVTLAVSQEKADWLKDIRALKSAATESLKETKKALKAGTLMETLGRKVLEKREDKWAEKEEDEQNRLIKEFTGGIHSVGHTWVRLSTYVGGKLRELYSYGFYPMQVYDPETKGMTGGYAGPTTAGPGQVRHPDTFHEGDSMKKLYDFEVPQDKYQKALLKAQKRYQSPPSYVLAGYNCTTFAREIVQTAGAKFPDPGLRVLHKRVYNPGTLYEALQKETGAYGGEKGKKDPLAETIEKTKTQTEERQVQEMVKVEVARKLGIPYAETLKLTFEDMAVLYALRRKKGKGSKLGFKSLLTLFDMANDDISRKTGGKMKVSLSFMGQLSEAGRARVAEHLGLSDEEFEQLRGELGETKKLESEKLEMIEAIQDLEFSEDEQRLLTYVDVMNFHILKNYQGSGGVNARAVMQAYKQADLDIQYFFYMSPFGEAKLAEFLGMDKQSLDKLQTDQETLMKLAKEEEEKAQIKEEMGQYIGLSEDYLDRLTWQDVGALYTLSDYEGKGGNLNVTLVKKEADQIGLPHDALGDLSDLGLTLLARFLGMKKDALKKLLNAVEREEKEEKKSTKEEAQKLLTPKLGSAIVKMFLPLKEPKEKSLSDLCKSLTALGGLFGKPNVISIMKNLTGPEKTAVALLLQVDVKALQNQLKAL